MRVIIDASEENLVFPAFLCALSAPASTVSCQVCLSVKNDDDDIALFGPVETDTCPKASVVCTEYFELSALIISFSTKQFGAFI